MSSQLDALLSDFCSKYSLGQNTPGFSMLIQQQDKPLFSFNTGIRSPTGEKITSESNFRLASISKQFTAVCILQLIEKEVVSFDTTLTQLFPDFPSYGSAITVQHLLTHTSGVEDYEDNLDCITEPQVSDDRVLEIAKSKTKGLFPPGSQYRYSNGGYCILALIVSRLSDLPFSEYLQKNVLIPADMEESCPNSG